MQVWRPTPQRHRRRTKAPSPAHLLIQLVEGAPLLQAQPAGVLSRHIRLCRQVGAVGVQSLQQAGIRQQRLRLTDRSKEGALAMSSARSGRAIMDAESLVSKSGEGGQAKSARRRPC